MANRFWVGTSDNNWNNANNWAASSGGAGGAGVPTTNDDAYFDSNGNVDCILNLATGVCLGFAVASGYIADFDLNGNTLQVGENGVALDAGMGFVHNNGTIELRSTHASTSSQLTSAGKILYDVWVNPVNNTGAIINDTLTCHLLDVDKGTCNISNRTVVTGSGGTGGIDVAVSATLNMTNASVICTRANFINAGTLTTTGSTLTMGGTFSPTVTLTTGGQALNNLTIAKGSYGVDASAGTVTVNGKLTLTSIGNAFNGTYDCKGDIDTAEDSANAWTAKVLMSGTGAQAITDIKSGGGGGLPDFEINCTGTVTFATSMEFGGGSGGGNITFKYTAGTVVFTPGIELTFKGQHQYVDTGSLVLPDIRIETGAWDIVGVGTVIVGGDMTVVSCGAWSSGATWDLRGNVEVQNLVNSEAQDDLWKFTGTAIQTLTGKNGGGTVPSIECAKTGGSLTVISHIVLTGANTYILWTSGALDFGTSTLEIKARSHAINLGGTSRPLYNVISDQFWTLTITGDVAINGTLTLTVVGTVNGGTLHLRGDVVNNDLGPVSGSCVFEFDGTGDQDISASASAWPNGNWIINKESGSVILGGDIILDGTGQDLVVTQGTLDLNGYDLTVDDILDIDDTLKLKGDETITVGTFQLDTSQSTVVYHGGAVEAIINDLAAAFFNLTLGASKTHKINNTVTVAGRLDSDGLAASRAVLKTTTPGTQKKLTLNGYSTLADKVDATDIDSNDGIEVLAPGSLISNTINWNVATGPAENPVGSGVVRRPGGQGLVKGVLEWT